MKKAENLQKTGKLNLPELENPVNSNVKKESFNAASQCLVGVWIGYHQD